MVVSSDMDEFFSACNWRVGRVFRLEPMSEGFNAGAYPTPVLCS